MIRDLFNSITLFNSINYIWRVKILFIFSKFKFWESLFPYFICMKHLYILIDFVNLFTYLHIIPNVVFDHNIKYGCSNAPFHFISLFRSDLPYLVNILLSPYWATWLTENICTGHNLITFPYTWKSFIQYKKIQLNKKLIWPSIPQP